MNKLDIFMATYIPCLREAVQVAAIMRHALQYDVYNCGGRVLVVFLGLSVVVRRLLNFYNRS